MVQGYLVSRKMTGSKADSVDGSGSLSTGVPTPANQRRFTGSVPIYRIARFVNRVVIGLGLRTIRATSP